MSLLKKAMKKINKVSNGLRPGTYLAEIIAVEDAPGYRAGDAFKLSYKIVDETTLQEYDKSEVFINDLSNPRTAQFVEYLSRNGVEVEDTLDFIGVKERLVFRYEVVNGERFLNISSREFVEKI